MKQIDFKTRRQGDMMLYKLTNPAHIAKLGTMVAKKVNKVVVGLGEVTGHSHVVLSTPNTELFQFFDNEKDAANLDIESDSAAEMERLFFEVKGELGLIVHEEHDAIQLSEGFYLRINQVQYDPFTQKIRKVAD
jgi:hypothetical protein